MEFGKDVNFESLLADAVTRRCPHCDVFARMAVIAAPRWEDLRRLTPARLGVVLDCSAEMPHGFPGLCGMFPEATEAMARIGSWVQQRIP